MDESLLLAEFSDDDYDVLRLYEADEDPDYIVLVQEVADETGVLSTSLAFSKDDLPDIVKVLTDFINS